MRSNGGLRSLLSLSETRSSGSATSGRAVTLSLGIGDVGEVQAESRVELGVQLGTEGSEVIKDGVSEIRVNDSPGRDGSVGSGRRVDDNSGIKIGISLEELTITVGASQLTVNSDIDASSDVGSSNGLDETERVGGRAQDISSDVEGMDPRAGQEVVAEEVRDSSDTRGLEGEGEVEVGRIVVLASASVSNNTNGVLERAETREKTPGLVLDVVNSNLNTLSVNLNQSEGEGSNKVSRSTSLEVEAGNIEEGRGVPVSVQVVGSSSGEIGDINFVVNSETDGETEERDVNTSSRRDESAGTGAEETSEKRGGTELKTTLGESNGRDNLSVDRDVHTSNEVVVIGEVLSAGRGSEEGQQGDSRESKATHCEM